MANANNLRIVAHWIVCPGCGAYGPVDLDQFNGRVSVDCSECAFHETRDWSSEDQQAEQSRLREQHGIRG